jgi:hypothetical protein
MRTTQIGFSLLRILIGIAVVFLGAPSCTKADIGQPGFGASSSMVQSSDASTPKEDPPDQDRQANSSTDLPPLPGVRIEFITQRATWTLDEAATGLQVEYAVKIDHDIANVHPAPQDSGWCGDPGPSGLVVFEDLRGNGQRYCGCNLGLCLEPPVEYRTLKRGSYPGIFEWEGKNSYGSTNPLQPKGDPFPPGRYALTLSGVGQRLVGNEETYFRVTGTFEFELISPDLVEE